MTVSGTNLINNKGINYFSSKKSNEATSGFFIDNIKIKQEYQSEETSSTDVDPIAIMEQMTGTSANYIPSYTVTEEEAEYFREKYGEEYDEENPYQLFYELAEKKIISSDDAARASGVSCVFSSYNCEKGGIWKENYSNFNCFGSYYDRFMNSYDKAISTWLDVSQREYDFWQYMIDLDERLVTPDGTHFQSSKEQMNVGFSRECESILKVKDVLTQIFD